MVCWKTPHWVRYPIRSPYKKESNCHVWRPETINRYSMNLLWHLSMQYSHETTIFAGCWIDIPFKSYSLSLLSLNYHQYSHGNLPIFIHFYHHSTTIFWKRCLAGLASAGRGEAWEAEWQGRGPATTQGVGIPRGDFLGNISCMDIKWYLNGYNMVIIWHNMRLINMGCKICKTFSFDDLIWFDMTNRPPSFGQKTSEKVMRNHDETVGWMFIWFISSLNFQTHICVEVLSCYQLLFHLRNSSIFSSKVTGPLDGGVHWYHLVFDQLGLFFWQTRGVFFFGGGVEGWG